MVMVAIQHIESSSHPVSGDRFGYMHILLNVSNSSESKVLQYFSNVRHKLAAPVALPKS